MPIVHLLRYTVPGEPVGKGRPRATKTGTIYTPPETRKYEAQARKAAQGGLAENGLALAWPMEATYHVTLGIYCAKPRKPDADNVFKAVTDAATGVLWTDDGNVGGTFWPPQAAAEPRVEVQVVAVDRVAMVASLEEHRALARRWCARVIAARTGGAEELFALTQLLLLAHSGGGVKP